MVSEMVSEKRKWSCIRDNSFFTLTLLWKPLLINFNQYFLRLDTALSMKNNEYKVYKHLFSSS